MKLIFRFLLSFIICCCLFQLSLCASTPKAKRDTSVSKAESHLPVIGIGYGALTFIGDIGNSYINQPFLYRGAFQLDVQLHTKSNLQIFFHILAGKIYGEEKSLNRNVNFMSNVMMEGANLRYSFNFKKIENQVIIPFISAGVEALTFNPFTDLKDANGTYYNYWSDGTIRDIAETASDASKSRIIRRDYNYETNVRDANLDSLGKFNQFAVAFPISVGIKFKISERASLNFTETYHLTTTDYIDGITSASLGSRSGKTGNDKILQSAVSFHYNLAVPRQTSKSLAHKKDQSIYSNVNFEFLEKQDTDGDGIPDFVDVDNSTPRGAKVDANGRALDSDGDGVPDYHDKQPNSVSGALVDENGVLINDSTQEAKYIRDSLDMEMTVLTERIKTKYEPAAGQSNAPVKPPFPDEYKSVDINLDGIISADEIAKAIELYTTGKSSFSKSQFYKLVDFFFAQ